MGGMTISSLSPGSLGATSGRQQATGSAQGTALSSSDQLTPQQQAEVRRLETVDREVRQHEQAHLAASGGYARSGASYTYTTGPDGKRYATGGEVSIDVSTARTPEATIQKMETVKRAAVAPANPSPQDRAVYAKAQQLEAEAQQEVTQAGSEQKSAGASTFKGYEGAISGSQNPVGQALDISV